MPLVPDEVHQHFYLSAKMTTIKGKTMERLYKKCAFCGKEELFSNAERLCCHLCSYGKGSLFASKACKAVPDSVRDKFRAMRKELEQKKDKKIQDQKLKRKVEVDEALHQKKLRETETLKESGQARNALSVACA